MKKLFLMAGFALLAASCSNESVQAQPRDQADGSDLSYGSKCNSWFISG